MSRFPRLALRYVPRSLLRGGRRTLVSLLCIAIGVAAVVALQVASLSVGDALTTNVRAANGGDISLSSTSATLSAADLGVFRQMARAGAITSWTAVSRVRATARGAGDRLVPFDAAVVDTASYPVGGEPTFVAPVGGNVHVLLRDAGDVLISSILADELGAGVGTRVTVKGVGGPGLSATVRGILAQASLEHAALMYVRSADQGAITTAPPQFIGVYVNVPGDPATIAAQLRQTFPQASVTTVSEAVANADQQVHDFHTYALLAGLVALLVAGVGIQNAMQSALASRLTEVAVLKAVGYPPLTVALLFAGEAAVLGTLGGIAGTVIGIAVSSGVTAAVAHATGLIAPVHIDAGVVLEGITLGLAATILFSLLPILGAVAVRPIGLLRGDLLLSRRSLPRYVGLVILLVMLFTALAGYITGDVRVSALLVAGGGLILGSLAVIFAAAVAGFARLRPTVSTTAAVVLTGAVAAALAATLRFIPAVAPLGLLALGVWAAATLGPRRWRLWLVMSARSLDRRRARTALTIVALFAGPLAAGLTMTMASGLRDQISQAIAANGSTNLVAIATPPWRDRLLQSAASLPGVQRSEATLISSGRATAVDGRPVAGALTSTAGFERTDGRLRALNGVTGFNLAGGDLPPGVSLTAGRMLGRGDSGTDNVIVDQSLGGPPASLHPGSVVTIADSSTGNQASFVVVGMYRSAGLRNPLTSRYSPRVLGDQSAAEQLAAGSVETVLSLTVTPGVLDRDSVTLQRANPSVLVANINDLTVVVRTVLDNLLLVLTMITAMVVIAGVAVVANSVTLALLERSREVALLKAVGFGPHHVLSMIILEYGLAGFLASATGVVSIAIALAILSRQVLQTPIAFSAGISTLLVATFLLVTGLTAWLAARRGAWMRPLVALRNS